MSSGMDPRIIRSLLSSTVGLISISAAIAALGSYELIIGAVSQISPSARAFLNSGETRILLANGLLGGGAVGIVSSVQFLVWNRYSPDSFWFQLFAFPAIVGIIMLVLGVFLLWTAHARVRSGKSRP